MEIDPKRAVLAGLVLVATLAVFLLLRRRSSALDEELEHGRRVPPANAFAGGSAPIVDDAFGVDFEALTEGAGDEAEEIRETIVRALATHAGGRLLVAQHGGRLGQLQLLTGARPGGACALPALVRPNLALYDSEGGTRVARTSPRARARIRV